MIYYNCGYLHLDAIKIISNENYRLWENLVNFPNGEFKDLATTLQ